MATLEELKQWCDKSRRLLKTTKNLRQSKQSAALKTSINHVLSRLREMEGQKALIRAYQSCLSDFEALQQELDRVSKQHEKAKESVRNDMQLMYASRFEDLAQRVVREIESKGLQAEILPDEKKALEELSKARGAYMKRYGVVSQQMELLKVTPKATTVNVERQMQQIVTDANADTVEAYNTARESLEQLASDIEKQQKVAERLHEDELSLWGKKPAALEKLRLAEEVYAEVSQLVGIEPQMKVLRGVLDLAQKEAKAQNWAAVLSALERAGTPESIRSKAQSDSQVQVGALDQVPRVGEATESLRKLGELLPAAEVAKHAKAWQQAQNVFLAAGLKGLGALDACIDTLGDAADKARDDTRELRLLRGDVSVLKSRLAQVAPALEMIPFQVRIDQMEALAVIKDLATAKEQAVKLKADLELAFAPRNQAKTDWQSKSNEAGQVRVALEELRSSRCTAVNKRIGQAMGYVSEAGIAKLEQERDWLQMVGNLAEGQKVLAELKQMHADYTALHKLRGKADETVKARREALNADLEKLKQALTEAAKGGKVADAEQVFVKEALGVTEQWRNTRRQFTAQGELEKARDQAIASLDDIGRRVLAACATDALTDLLKSDASAKSEPTFNEDWKKFDAALTSILAFDMAVAAELLTAGQQIKSRAPADFVLACADLAELSKRAARALDLQTSILEQEHAEVTEAARLALAEIERVKQASRTSKQFAEAFKSLQTDHDELVLMGASGNRGAIKEALEGLKALKTRATLFAPESPGSGTSMKKVVEVLGNANDLLEGLKETLKKNDPKALDTLSKQLAQLKIDIYATDPEQGMLKLAAFTQACTSAEKNAGVVAGIREEYAQLLPTVKTAFANFKKRKIAPEYTDDLQARLEAAQNLAAQPAKLYEALQKLKTLDQELSAATTNLSEAMDKEKGLIELRHKQEAEEAEWKRTVELFEKKQLPAAVQAIQASGGDMALAKELDRMLSLARRSAKDGDHVKALQEIGLAAVRARQIMQDPYGPAIGARNQLPKDNERYGAALANFNRSLDGLLDATLKMVDGLNPKVEARLRGLITSVKSKFNPFVLSSALQKLSASGLTDGERRAQREAALTILRGVQATLADNVQIQMLLKNPVAKSEFSVAFRALQARLAALDANIQRSCA